MITLATIDPSLPLTDIQPVTRLWLCPSCGYWGRGVSHVPTVPGDWCPSCGEGVSLLMEQEPMHRFREPADHRAARDLADEKRARRGAKRRKGWKGPIVGGDENV